MASRRRRAAGTQSLRSKALRASATTSYSAAGGWAGPPQAPSASARRTAAARRVTSDVAEAHATLDHRVLIAGGPGLRGALGAGSNLDPDLPDVGQRVAQHPVAVVAPDLERLH